MDILTVYGREIPAFLLDALATPPMQRLKNVGMNCGCEYTRFPRFASLQPYSRYEHSLGVALIVWRHTGDRAQAMAGLLHDISTPVFAHVVDFLKGDYLTQESTEEGTEQCILASEELMEVLSRYGLTVDEVKDYHRYPVADNDSPKLSADRLEYTLGNMVNYGFAPVSEAAELYEDIMVGRNESGGEELMFRREECALRFARLALQCSRVYVSDEDRCSMQLLSELLKEAVCRGVIDETDLGTTESAVIKKLRADRVMAEKWQSFQSLSRTETSLDAPPGGGWRKVFAKKRFIDPFIYGSGRASALNSGFAAEKDAYLAQSQDFWVRALP